MTAGPLLHADADAFFASVALRTRPDLVARPVAVVAHVFVASANYPARDRGVRSGTLVGDALRRCPDLVLLDVPHAEIDEVGDALFDLFHDCAQAVEPGSVEEAFLDVGAPDRAGAVRAAADLRRRAAGELRIPVSVGVGRTKLMAKLASRAAKPDGLHVIDGEREAELRVGLPTADVWGIGARTHQRLDDLGVTRLGEIDRVHPTELRRACGTAMARRLWGVRAGNDDATVRPVERRSAIGAEGSISGYARPDRTPGELLDSCVERVCRRAERAGLAGTKITVSPSPASGRRGAALHGAVSQATSQRSTWLPLAREILGRRGPDRLTGLRVTLSGLVPADRVQATLF